MPYLIKTEFGHAVPPAPRHSVTVHMPKWTNVEKIGADPRSVIATLHNAYPRMKPHRDIVSLSEAVLNVLGLQHENQACLLTASLQSAEECVNYAISPRRDDVLNEQKRAVDRNTIGIRRLCAKDDFYAVTFPKESASVVFGFWTSPGVGISSRLAEANLAHLDKLHEVTPTPPPPSPPRTGFESQSHQIIRERIVHCLNRASLQPTCNAKVAADDVFLFPSGMASIYKPHSYFNRSSEHNGTTVLFGMAFMNTLTAFQDFANNFKFFGLGTSQDLIQLEEFLDDERQAGRKVSSIWTEFPANPILVTPDLEKLRELADRHNVFLVVDDTLGSFANIDVLPMADVLVTSLTKSFNGYADAIAGSAVLNPSSKHYRSLKVLFDQNYVSELYILDAETIEKNSRDYLQRTATLNRNAHSLVEYIDTHVRTTNPQHSSITRVHYPHPEINSSGQNYAKFMRRDTPELTPGYGCLFNIEFKDLVSTSAFYDIINIHNGPHLGAPFTLAFAYTMCAYGSKLEWAAQFGLKPTQIRIAAGLEDTTTLLEIFKEAIAAADDVYWRSNHDNSEHSRDNPTKVISSLKEEKKQGGRIEEGENEKDQTYSITIETLSEDTV